MCWPFEQSDPVYLSGFAHAIPSGFFPQLLTSSRSPHPEPSSIVGIFAMSQPEVECSNLAMRHGLHGLPTCRFLLLAPSGPARNSQRRPTAPRYHHCERELGLDPAQMGVIYGSGCSSTIADPSELSAAASASRGA